MLSLYISNNLITHLHLLTWFLFPQKNINGTWTTYQWLCVTVNVNKASSVQKNWSDDDVIRQMKNLEKEVESTPAKAKAKPSLKKR